MQNPLMLRTHQMRDMSIHVIHIAPQEFASIASIYFFALTLYVIHSLNTHFVCTPHKGRFTFRG